VLDAFDLDVLDLRRPFHEVAAELTREELPTPIQNALEEIRAVVARESATLADAVQAIHATLTGPIQRAESASLGAWSDAEKKILQALKRANETRLAQLEKARLHLFPDGKPQERVLNVFYYLFRYGDSFLEGVAEEFDVQIQTPAP
jgi:uncharacterized protein YllA (UPF0747 family)